MIRSKSRTESVAVGVAAARVALGTVGEDRPLVERFFAEIGDRIVNQVGTGPGSLEALIAVLESCGEIHWSERLRQVSSDFAGTPDRALAILRSCFGGMGSLNDVFLAPENKHQVARADVDRVNAELDRLRVSLWRDVSVDGPRGNDGSEPSVD